MIFRQNYAGSDDILPNDRIPIHRTTYKSPLRTCHMKPVVDSFFVGVALVLRFYDQAGESSDNNTCQ